MKYTVLLLGLSLVCCVERSENKSNPKTEIPTEIKSPDNGGFDTFTLAGKSIQVAKEDQEIKMNWNMAMQACQNLGDGWRLPKKEELEAMHEQLHKQGKGNFKTDWVYWSSTEEDGDVAFDFSFNDGTAAINYHDGGKNTLSLVRAVRDLP